MHANILIRVNSQPTFTQQFCSVLCLHKILLWRACYLMP